MSTIDVGAAIDRGPFGTYQKLLIGGTALLVVLDGVDNQLLPHAIPSMTMEWGLPRAAFATASAAAPLGMILGGIAGGVLGDRIGRRSALLGSVVWFALTTLAIAMVETLTQLTLLRFVAGIGLGAAMPNAAALASEFVPARHRPLAVTLTIVCIPLGGFLAGLVAGQVVPGYGWRLLFVAGGGVPVLLALILVWVMPESPRYLASRPQRWPELRLLLARFGHAVPEHAEFTEAATVRSAAASSLGQLFSRDLRRDTCGLMGAFASCLLAIYVGFLWIPAMLADPAVGFSQPAASYALSLFNFGGVGGALAGALVIQRLGSRAAMLGMSGLTILAAVLMAALPMDPRVPFTTMTLFLITGGLMNAVQTTMFALAAHVYPTAIRGTGVGATVAVGRVGNTLASYVGSWALSSGGPPLYFATWAAAMTVVFASLAIVRRHIPPAR